MEIQIPVHIHDESLAEDLLELEIPGVTVLTRLRAAVGVQDATEIILVLANKLALPLLLVWLGKKIEQAENNKRPDQVIEEMRKLRRAIEKGAKDIAAALSRRE